MQPIATEPEWPDEELPKIGDYLRLAFGKDRLIEDLDHPIARFLLAGVPL